MNTSIRRAGMSAFIVAAAILGSSSTLSAALVDISDPQNVLDGQTATVSSTHVLSGTFGLASKLVDNLAADNLSDDGFIFSDTDGNQRISISGFNSGFYTVRIYTVQTDSNRSIGTVVLRSSTTLTSSLTAGDYETELGTFTTAERVYLPYVPSVHPLIRGYFDMTVSAPAGTQSLYLGLVGPSGQGERAYEVQALIPEPATCVLLGLVLTAATARRRRA